MSSLPDWYPPGRGGLAPQTLKDHKLEGVTRVESSPEDNESDDTELDNLRRAAPKRGKRGTPKKVKRAAPKKGPRRRR